MAATRDEPGVGEEALRAVAQTLSLSDAEATLDSTAGHEEDSHAAEPYYWEAGGDPRLDLWGRLWHQVHFGGMKAKGLAEAIGEVVANTLGLNDSVYQYVIDALEADEARCGREEREREERNENDRRELEANSGGVELGNATLATLHPSAPEVSSAGTVIDVPLS